MNFITDSFFQQGETHEVCEDYAVHGNGYAIVSDGCSNGGGPSIHTDWGSRLLCKAAEYNLFCLTTNHDRMNFNERKNLFFHEVWSDAAKIASSLPNLQRECLTATLGIAYKDLGVVRTILYGDGVVGARRRDGKWEIRSYEPIQGAPYYLKYQKTEGDALRYFERFDGRYKASTYVCDGKLGVESTQTATVAIDPDNPAFDAHFPVEEYDLVFVGTDGLSAFFQKVNTGTSKHNEPVSLLSVLGVLLDANFNRPGCLRLQRHWAFKRTLAGTFPQRGWHTGDDVSLGIVHAQAD